jgi:hypothetical protein
MSEELKPWRVKENAFSWSVVKDAETPFGVQEVAILSMLEKPLADEIVADHNRRAASPSREIEEAHAAAIERDGAHTLFGLLEKAEAALAKLTASREAEQLAVAKDDLTYIAEQCEAVSRLPNVELTEGRTWKVIARLAREAAKKITAPAQKPEPVMQEGWDPCPTCGAEPGVAHHELCQPKPEGPAQKPKPDHIVELHEKVKPEPYPNRALPPHPMTGTGSINDACMTCEKEPGEPCPHVKPKPEPCEKCGGPTIRGSFVGHPDGEFWPDAAKCTRCNWVAPASSEPKPEGGAR